MTIAVPRGTLRGPLAFARPRADARTIRRVGLAAAMLLAVAPLLWPTIPPLIDLPNHMSRYRVGLDYASYAPFRAWFDFHWVLVGNLGVDLLVAALAPSIGLEPATKLVVTAIPLLTALGFAGLAREAHGRVPATAAFALLFLYNFPFNYGFVNYSLAVALALDLLWLWAWLGRRGALRLRMWLLAPGGLLVWVAHALGWGLLGVMLFAWEAAARQPSLGWRRAIAGAVVACLPLALPLVPMLAWFGGDANASSGMLLTFDIYRKVGLLFLSLRNAVAVIDIGTVVVVLGVLALAIGRRDMRFEPRLVAVATALLLTYALMPADLMGSGWVDMRIAPYVAAMFALSLRPAAPTRFARSVALVGIAAFAAHTAYQTWSYLRLDRVWNAQLTALDHIPEGVRVFGLVGADCIWRGDRMDHVQRLATVRRHAFTNGTWPPSCQQTYRIRPGLAAARDPSNNELLVPAGCRTDPSQTVPAALARLPRERWDYVWLVNVPRRQWPTRSWLQPVWHGPRGIVYRILTPAEVRRGARTRLIARRLA